MLDRSILDSDWNWKSVINKLARDGIFSTRKTAPFCIKTKRKSPKEFPKQCQDQFRETNMTTNGGDFNRVFIYKGNRYFLSKNGPEIKYGRY